MLKNTIISCIDERFNEFNEANQLKKVKWCSGSQTIAEYVYDYNGQRMVKKNYSFGTLMNTVYSWSDMYEARVVVGGSTESTSYYFVNNELIAKKDNSGNKTYFHNDHLGSTTVITDQSGAFVESTKYDPWGEVRSGGIKSKFQYTGQEKDSETGLNYYDSRFYDAHIKRFVQPDTWLPDVYSPQQLNRYAYANNNPLRYTDPSGHFAIFTVPIAYWIAGAIGTGAVYFSTLQGQQVTKTAITSTLALINDLRQTATAIVSNIYNAAKSGIVSQNKSSPQTKSNTQPTNKSGSSEGGTSQSPKPQKIDPQKWVKDNFKDPSKEPGNWRETKYGPQPNDRTYYNPKTKETLSPDLQHGPNKAPHWDYRDPSKKWWRILENGDMIAK